LAAKVVLGFPVTDQRAIQAAQRPSRCGREKGLARFIFFTGLTGGLARAAGGRCSDALRAAGELIFHRASPAANASGHAGHAGPADLGFFILTPDLQYLNQLEKKIAVSLGPRFFGPR